MTHSRHGMSGVRIRTFRDEMRRRLVTALVATIAAFAAFAEPAVAAVPSSLSYDKDAPDPFVLKDGSTYFAYSTEVYFTNVPVMSSATLGGGWGTPKEALPKLPAWAKRGRTWAPAVAKLGSTYVLYFTAWHKDSGRQCIGAATASSPVGPFNPTSSRPFVCQLEFGGSIDPSVFFDGGTPYLLWKSEDNAINRESRIWSRQLSSSGTSFAYGSTASVLVQHDHRSWEGYTIEGPTMVKAGGRYQLFYGAGAWWENGASIGRATCTAPTGGCAKQGQWLTSSSNPWSPSGPEVFLDGTKMRMVHHGWRPNGTGYENKNWRAIYAGTLSFDSAGTPTLTGV
jgi:beta-xylosidase